MELVIIEKSSDCFKYLHNALNYFPKSEKFVMATDKMRKDAKASGCYHQLDGRSGNTGGEFDIAVVCEYLYEPAGSRSNRIY